MKNAVDFLKSCINRVMPSRRHPDSHESFRALFDRFKEVLEANNKSLEIITDMGEKFGGDYLFDITYVRNAYTELIQQIGRSIQSFDTLTHTRYPQLREAFVRIDRLIQLMVYNVPSVLRGMIVFFEDISRDMTRDVGGKNAHLSEVKNYLKLNVPDGFAITALAFDAFMRHNELSDKISALSKGPFVTDEAIRVLQESIMGGDIPPELDSALKKALGTLREKRGDCFVAVRSSAEEEDGEFSFAGQFETVLNVPLKDDAIEDAFKRVISSLFSAKAIAYQRRLGYAIGQMRMAVGCMVMVDSVTSGVIYSTNPDGDRDTLLINATWGQGKSVVEGQVDADLYVVKKGNFPQLVYAKYGKKQSMITNSEQGGITEVRTPSEMASKPSLTPEQITELAKQAMSIEKYFGSPRDIEWASGRDGSIYILQSRPLPMLDSRETAWLAERPTGDEAYPVLFRDQGVVVQKGAGAGKVFIVRQVDELDTVPRGAVLVARHDSSLLVRVMPFVSAIITETGTPTSHMATLSRELKVPTIVNAGNVTRILKQEEEVTVYAGDDNTVGVYKGIVRGILSRAQQDSARMENIYEFRKKRYILRYISPLNLVDPLMEEFTPEGCKTMHDILRFIHEKAVAELVENARREGERLRGSGKVIKLDIPIPTGILVMDMGGGLDIHHDDKKATFQQITSVPLKAIVKGMMHPGVWQSEAVSLGVNDFLSSMMRMSDIVSDSERFAGYNVAVISKEYVNLSLRFGYHFNMLDCYCGEFARNNHIYFRFVGGATDITKRSRRVELIAMILREYGFSITTKGDLIVARLTNIEPKEMEDILDQTGRLIAFTRQLDALLCDERAVTNYAQKFLKGEYEF